MACDDTSELPLSKAMVTDFLENKGTADKLWVTMLVTRFLVQQLQLTCDQNVTRKSATTFNLWLQAVSSVIGVFLADQHHNPHTNPCLPQTKYQTSGRQRRLSMSLVLICWGSNPPIGWKTSILAKLVFSMVNNYRQRIMHG